MEKKRKRGKEVASTCEDSPTKNTRSKRGNVAKKIKSKKRILADLM
jgi:hypothetical protein